MMECDDAIVERQKLVSNDEEDDQNITNISSAQKSTHTPISPVLSSNNKIYSSGSQNSNSFSIGGKTQIFNPPQAQSQDASTKLMYVNERKSQDKGKTKRVRDLSPKSVPSSVASSNPDTLNGNLKALSDDSTCTATNNVTNNSNLPKLKTIQSKNSSSYSSLHKNSFASRPLKHHSFISEMPDVRYMERALLGLLDDFHSGKLKAFGSGFTMEQMNSIREQQESLAKLHFDLGNEVGLGNDNEIQSQNNMRKLVQKLENLSICIEKLQISETGAVIDGKKNLHP